MRETICAGDFHNHTTFSAGSTSIEVLIDKAIATYDLDWFAQSGHGGAFSRDGRYNDPEYDGSDSGEGAYLTDTVSAILGDYAGTGYGGKENMWRWQSLQELAYPETHKAALHYGMPVWQALEWQVPGHEHCSLGIIDQQYSALDPNADGLAEFEYLFDYKDNDTSQRRRPGLERQDYEYFQRYRRRKRNAQKSRKGCRVVASAISPHQLHGARAYRAKRLLESR